MAGGLTFTMTGWSDLENRLKQLSSTDATKAGQSANRAAAAYMVKKIREAAPDGPSAEGSIRNRKRKSGTVVQEKHEKIKNHVRVRKGRANDANTVENLVIVDPYHASYEEFGSIHNQATHFVEKTFDRESQAALDVMAKALNKGLIRRGV